MIDREEVHRIPEPFCPHCDNAIGGYHVAVDCKVVSTGETRGVLINHCPHCGDPFHAVERRTTPLE